MFETMTSFVLGDHFGGLTYDPPLDEGGYARHIAKDRRPYATKDGFISVIVYNDKQWESFFNATKREDLRADPRFATFAGRAANIDVVYGELGNILKGRTTAEWVDFFIKADIPVMPVHTLTSILDDPHMKAIDFFEAVEHPSEGAIRSMRPAATFSATPIETPRLAPRRSEHAVEILKENGYSDSEIAGLLRDGVTQTDAKETDMKKVARG
jgi:crotonobetainyl-CoA:carnitine CoA-transferase CaiB-like acyl-CoA transferase